MHVRLIRVALILSGLAAIVLGLSAVPAGAAPAHHAGRIVGNKSVAGIKIGVKQQTVRRKLGKPESHHCFTDDHKNCLIYSSQRLEVGLYKHHVLYVATWRKRDKLPSGIHAGSSWKSFQATDPRCTEKEAPGCFLKEPNDWFPKNGQRFTFVENFPAKKVADIVVGKYKRNWDTCVFGECAN